MKTEKLFERMFFMEKLAPIMSVVHRSEEPQSVFTYSPGICTLKSGRMIATLDTFDKRIDEKKGYIYISDDRGESWEFICTFPFYHARPFVAGDSVYIIGHYGEMYIIRSDDEGSTWSVPSKLAEGKWHQAPCNVWYAENNVYLVMERVTEDIPAWPVSVLAPVLMRANVNDDLLQRDNWTFATEMTHKNFIELDKCNYFGVPFYPVTVDGGTKIADDRIFWAPGWLETNVVRFDDPNHFWYDENGKTLHLFMRTNTGNTNIAAVLKVTEEADGSMTTSFQNDPAGKPMVFIPFPGGHMKFHIIYDEKTKLYWLLGSQSTDSMTRPECLPPERYDLPNNERNRLVLHFSKNCIDWCFAGVVDAGDTTIESRHYASMSILGDDLFILSRSGDKMAKSPHDTDMITLHKVENFRDLVY